MAKKPIQKSSRKKPEKTLMEKRSAKKAKKAAKSTPFIPLTDR